jgi:tetratricopeptide (TPR) repeat protein
VASDPLVKVRRLRWALLGAALIAAGALVTRAACGDDLEQLGGVGRPPVWLGAPVGAEGTGDSLFEAGMADYEAGRWEAAAETLERVLAAGADPLPTGFFLGVSRLMAGQPGAAVEALETVIARGESPYLGEARYYRAKALLQLDRGDEALVELEAAETAGGTIGEAASALADSVRDFR